MNYTEREREILNNWPTVTEQDLVRMNNLFQHYLFFRRVNTMGLVTIDLRTSCCGYRETRAELPRTESPEHRKLLDHLKHKESWTCPWCGRDVTVINLSKAGKRKSLSHTEWTVLLHTRGDALYADALVLYKGYEDDETLTARPTGWCSSGYRFSRGEVMQADYQVTYRDNEPFITYERDKLGRKKLVQEPFKNGSICWYSHESYSILNREVLDGHPFFRYCGFFRHWQYRPGGARGYAFRFHDFVSYLTAYSIYPRQMEMLVKGGLYRPIADLIFERKKTRRLCAGRSQTQGRASDSINENCPGSWQSTRLSRCWQCGIIYRGTGGSIGTSLSATTSIIFGVPTRRPWRCSGSSTNTTWTRIAS